MQFRIWRFNEVIHLNVLQKQYVDKNFINLLPFLKAPVYITITKIDVAKVLFINIGNIVVVNRGGRVQIIPLKDPATKAIDNKVVNK